MGNFVVGSLENSFSYVLIPGWGSDSGAVGKFLSKTYACRLLKTLGAQVAVARGVARKPSDDPTIFIGPCAAAPGSAALCKA